MKRILLIISSLLFILLLAGCSSAETALTPEPIEFNAIEDDTEEIYSVNKNLPSGYTLSLPLVENPSFYDWNDMAREREDGMVHEIEISKDEKIVFTVDFFNRKDNYKSLLESLKNAATKGSASGSDTVKLIKEINSDDLNYALFYIEQPSVPDKQHANYCRFIGEFPKSQNTAFEIRTYLTQKEAEKIFESLDLKYLHE